MTTTPCRMSGRYCAITFGLKKVSRKRSQRRTLSAAGSAPMKARVRSCARALEDLRPAAPARRSAPSSMNTTRSAASRAKPISWLTTIMVMPRSRSSRMTASTEPTSSGSSARGRLVEQHHPRLERERAGDRDALLLAAGQLARIGLGLRRRARPARAPPGRASSASARDLPDHLAQRQRHVAERRHVRIEVEGLEHHADACAAWLDVGRARHQVDAVDHDRAARSAPPAGCSSAAACSCPSPTGR